MPARRRGCGGREVSIHLGNTHDGGQGEGGRLVDIYISINDSIA